MKNNDNQTEVTIEREPLISGVPIAAAAAGGATALAPSAGANTPAPSAPVGASLRGTNQSGMRAFNERLVLTLVYRNAGLAQRDIARVTGLSAQTVSVIIRQLERDGLLLRGEPMRGRVGVAVHRDDEGSEPLERQRQLAAQLARPQQHQCQSDARLVFLVVFRRAVDVAARSRNVDHPRLAGVGILGNVLPAA
ncbi:MAG: winged helix-turn-helix domain-containing protein, partial [Phyllobacteriaceae bacterium]|nr:winged helix-turn-helix domain-containing protein [Phyllobacteriaceae bacterium]